MNIIEELETRGLVFQCTALDDLKARVLKGPITVYAGFDPTASSLHIGNLVSLITLARFQKAGHTPIAVIGGATGLIGDPSGKSAERKFLTEEELASNVSGIEKEIKSIIDETKTENSAKVVNNKDWTEKLGFLEVLRTVGKYFSINEMIRKDSVRSRLEEREQGISYTEFSYMVLQAYDFYILNNNNNCDLQIGGSDQWGNITAGADLIKKRSQKTAFGLTTPLITDFKGNKFGKTEKGAIFLSAEKTAPFQFYQFWMRVEDADVIKFLKLFTFLSLEEIQTLEESLKIEPHKRLAQKALAEQITMLIHGQEVCTYVQRASDLLFNGELCQLDEQGILDVLKEAPTFEVEFKEGQSLIDLLAQLNIVVSKREVKNLIKNGGLYINDMKISEATAIGRADLLFNKYLIVRTGKKNYSLITFK